MMTIRQFQKTILAWHRVHGRHDLPWRRKRDARDPYRVLVSEIMLQQTQVDRVIPKYKSFLKKFPTANALASASVREVLREWKGLGYNRRALFLKRAAEKITGDLRGKFPRDEDGLRALPGVGGYTARAISVFCFNRPAVFIETNIRRVFIHFFFDDVSCIPDAEIMPLVARALLKKDPQLWYGALMDYGAGALSGIPNPNRKSANYARQSKFEGSTRQARAEVLRWLLLRKNGAEVGAIRRYLKTHSALRKYAAAASAKEILRSLVRDGFLAENCGRWVITDTGDRS